MVSNATWNGVRRAVLRLVPGVILCLIVPPRLSEGQGLGFYTVTPCRVADTRNPAGPFGGPALSANSDRAFTFAGRCGVPSTADSVAVNVTVTGATSVGLLRLYPGGQAPPLASAVNYGTGQTRANNGIYALGADGALGVHCDQSSGTVHVIFDVTGYFDSVAQPPTPTPTPTPIRTPTPTPTQPPPVGPHPWSKDFGGPYIADSAFPLGLAVDGLGEIVVAGHFQGTVDMGTGSLTSATSGSGDMFVAKYSANGTPLWSRRIGGAQDDRAKAVAVDGSGNVFITGYFRETVDFGGGPVTSVPFGANTFLAKYSPQGAHLWSKRLSTATGIDEGTALAVDGSGNVLLAGVLYQTSNFGGGNLTSAGNGDVFVAMFSSSGAHLWSRRAGGAGDDHVYGLDSDSGGSAVVTGSFQASVDFGGAVLASAGGKDVFLAKYSPAGTHVWSRRFGGGQDDVARSVAVDGSDNVVVAGNFLSSAADFGSGALSNSGGADIFLAKYTPTGSGVWSKRFGSTLTLDEVAFGVGADEAGNVLLTGTVVDTIDFGGGAVAGDGYYDIFLAKFASGGSHLWSKRTGAGAGVDIAADASGYVIVTGHFSGATPVNFGGSDLESPGGTDTFLAKLGP